MKLTKNKIIYEKNWKNVPSKCLAFVIPETIEEIQKVVRSNELITIRGSGTSLTGGCTAHNSVVIDMSKLNKVIDINPNKKIVVVEAGILVSDLNTILETSGLEFPIETIFYGVETIGGMIAKNSCGSREIKYNRMMNWIDSLEIVNAKGELLKISKSEMSDFIGLEGITGVIVRASLRLTNKKKKTISILKSNNLEDIFKANSRLRLNQDISSIELLNKDISYLLGLEKKYHLFIEYENNEGLFKEQEYVKFFKLKNKAFERVLGEGLFYIESVKIFQDSIEDFIIYLEQNSIQYFSHFASGVFYLCFHPTQIDKRNDTLRFAKKINGKIAYNSGFGITNKEFLEFGEKEIIKRIKKRRDSEFKFNKYILLNPLDFSKEKSKDFEEDVNEDLEKQGNAKDKEEEEIQTTLDTDEKLIETFNLKTQKQRIELSEEEKEKVKKLAAGFFAGGKKEE